MKNDICVVNYVIFKYYFTLTFTTNKQVNCYHQQTRNISNYPSLF